MVVSLPGTVRKLIRQDCTPGLPLLRLHSYMVTMALTRRNAFLGIFSMYDNNNIMIESPRKIKFGKREKKAFTDTKVA